MGWSKNRSLDAKYVIVNSWNRSNIWLLLVYLFKSSTLASLLQLSENGVGGVLSWKVGFKIFNFTINCWPLTLKYNHKAKQFLFTRKSHHS